MEFRLVLYWWRNPLCRGWGIEARRWLVALMLGPLYVVVGVKVLRGERGE